MKFGGKLMLLLILGGSLFPPCLLTANMAPLVKLKGGIAAPKSPHTSIRLVSQEVIIRLRSFTYRVNAVFRLSNTGDTTTEWVGFPKRMPLGALSPEDSDFLRFDAWVDGRKSHVREERVTTYAESHAGRPPQDNRWMVQRVTFPDHSTTTIRVTYEAAYDGMFFVKGMSYVYGTGSYWKGTIGRAVFVIDSVDIGGTKNIKANLRAGTRIISENVVRFEIIDFEPPPEAELTIGIRRDRELKVGPSVPDHM